MQRVKVHELRKLTDADLVERLTKERVSCNSALWLLHRKSSLKSESAKFPLKPRWTCPRSECSEKVLPKCSQSWPKREELRPVKLTRRASTRQRIWDKRKPEPTADVSLLLSRTSLLTAPRRELTTLDPESTPLLHECLKWVNSKQVRGNFRDTFTRNKAFAGRMLVLTARLSQVSVIARF